MQNYQQPTTVAGGAIPDQKNWYYNDPQNQIVQQQGYNKDNYCLNQQYSENSSSSSLYYNNSGSDNNFYNNYNSSQSQEIGQSQDNSYRDGYRDGAIYNNSNENITSNTYYDYHPQNSYNHYNYNNSSM